MEKYLLERNKQLSLRYFVNSRLIKGLVKGKNTFLLCRLTVNNLVLGNSTDS